MTARQVFRHYPEGVAAAGGEFRFCPYCVTALERQEIGNRQRPACPECGFVQFRNPAPTVSVLVADGDRLLLGKRDVDPGRGQWSVPSGYIEYDDDFLRAAIREVKEETGLEVEIEAILNLVSSFLAPRWHFLGVYLLARMRGGRLAAGDDLVAVDWFPVGGPSPELAFEEDEQVIRLYAAGEWRGLAVDPAHAGAGS